MWCVWTGNDAQKAVDQLNYDFRKVKGATNKNNLFTTYPIFPLYDCVANPSVFFANNIWGTGAYLKKLEDFIGKQEILNILDEYNERKTEEAIFAYHCDKLECDIQIKLYDQEECFDLNHQTNNPIINIPSIKKVLDCENSISNAWIEFDRNKYEDDPIFIDIINWLKDNKI